MIVYQEWASDNNTYIYIYSLFIIYYCESRSVARERQSERQRETERETERDRERDRERQRERQSEAGGVRQ